MHLFKEAKIPIAFIELEYVSTNKPKKRLELYFRNICIVLSSDLVKQLILYSLTSTVT